METKSEIVHKTDNLMVIKWSGSDGFGEITLKYTGNGGYDVDAEYMDFDTMMKIFQAIDLEAEIVPVERG